jgi:hypothetical protein
MVRVRDMLSRRHALRHQGIREIEGGAGAQPRSGGRSDDSRFVLSNQ